MVQLVNYFPEPIRKIVGGFKENVVRLFHRSKPENYGKQTVYEWGKKLSKLKIQEKLKVT